MQLWPELMSRAPAPAVAASSTSQSSNTMKGSLPPSSATIGLRWRPATAATSLPARELPVSVTPRIRRSAMQEAACSFVRKRFWTSPSGAPASRYSSTIRSAHWGTEGACFSTIAFPVMQLGADTRMTCQSGKFQGMTARIGPMGS